MYLTDFSVNIIKAFDAYDDSCINREAEGQKEYIVARHMYRHSSLGSTSKNKLAFFADADFMQFIFTFININVFETRKA